jgi:predicted nucleotidyltransferase
MERIGGLPEPVERNVALFVDAVKAAFAEDLVSIVLFGSAAEGQMRATSDVNIILVLKRFAADAAEKLREPMQFVHAAADLKAMFLLESEIASAMEAFTVKFADIIGRHRVLYGADPFPDRDLPRPALIRRLDQVLLNLQLRLRERYVTIGGREELLARIIADAAGPLRASAASLLRLEGAEAVSPKAALKRIAGEAGDPALPDALDKLSIAREKGLLPAGTAAPTLLALIALAGQLRARVDRLKSA